MKKPSHKKAIGLNQYKKAIGIDVCNGFVNVVSLERNFGKVSIVGHSRIAIKESAGGNGVENLKSIASAVKKSGLASYIRHSDAGMCLSLSPELLQILNLPDSSPDSAMRFIHDEIKQYAVLPLKNIKMDYCALRAAGSSEQKRVLVGASPAEPLGTITKEFEKDYLDVRLIEPAVVALIRACYNKVIKPARQSNVMLVLLRDDNMSLCVFSSQKFDFLRTKKFDFDISNSTDHVGAIAEQIDSVIQFYELERVSDQKNWPIFIACSPDSSKAKEIAQQLKGHLHRQNIEISAIDASHIDIIVEDETNSDFSPVAAGVAMKLLDVNDSGININLLPDEIYEIRKSRNQMFVMANIAAVILLLVLMYITFLLDKSTSITRKINREKQSISNIDMSQLLLARADVNDKTQQVVGDIDALKTIFKKETWHNWASVMAQLCTIAPPTIQIQNLQARDSLTVQIEGMAINYNSINDFINRLTACKIVSSAQLADTKQNTQYGNGLIDYSIVCSLAK